MSPADVKKLRVCLGQMQVAIANPFYNEACRRSAVEREIKVAMRILGRAVVEVLTNEDRKQAEEAGRRA